MADTNKNIVITSNNGSLTQPDAVFTSAWYHVVVTFAGGACNMYVNGVLGPSGTISKTSFVAVNGAYLVIGNNHPGGQEHLNGNPSVCRIYNRVLAITEVQGNFNALRGRFGV